MRIGDIERPQLDIGLQSFAQQTRVLPGLHTVERRQSLVEQIIDSMRRVEYVRHIRQMDLSPERANPASALFDPLKAAILHHREGDLDEACWLTFLSTYCGRHPIDRWQLARDIYNGYGGAGIWTWGRVSSNLNDFYVWLAEQYAALVNDGITRRFGNHRKYETLKPDSPRGPSRVVQTYVEWVGANRGHALLIDEARQTVGADPKSLFDHLYRSMRIVRSFGRTGRFDYLTMVGKLALANIEPGIPYLHGATGPLTGAKLLFGGSKASALGPTTLDAWTAELGTHLNVGMQVMEDAMCNWQKSPDVYLPFRG